LKHGSESRRRRFCQVWNDGFGIAWWAIVLVALCRTEKCFLFCGEALFGESSRASPLEVVGCSQVSEWG
jgi:hypothetical protein